MRFGIGLAIGALAVLIIGARMKQASTASCCARVAHRAADMVLG